jgi:hypothetical protein
MQSRKRTTSQCPTYSTARRRQNSLTELGNREHLSGLATSQLARKLQVPRLPNSAIEELSRLQNDEAPTRQRG